MLSENLNALSARLAQYAPTGVELAPDAVAAVCQLIDVCANDARELEAQTVPLALRGRDYTGPKIVPIRRACPVAPSGDGDAA